MARKKIEFRPDPTGYDVAGKLHLTRQQRQSLLKWVLYSLICVLGLVLQDSMLARLRFLGGGFQIAPALVILICVLEGCESGSVFALCASLIYVFSGSAQGRYCIVLLTLVAVLAAAFRQSYLRMNYLPSDAVICNHDQVVTAGSTLYPRDLVLGSVIDAGFDETGVAKFAILEPAADFGSLEQIFVLTSYGVE